MKELEKQRHLPLRTQLMVWLLYLSIRALCWTVRLRVDREAETNHLIGERGGLLVTWHGRVLLPINRFRRREGFHGLISMSRDGDLQAEIFRRYGMGVVRGSTGRRAVLATREVLTLLERGQVVICTPDGPRGPIGQAQAGALYFAQRTGRPIIPAGISAFPRWQLGSWDRFLVPKPFARARWIYGEPIYVTPDESLESAQQRLTEAINRLQQEAENAVRT
ncbi:MAG: lysophospholipid acyltransferase family protein [Cytophagales bacterium]|nr:lysophospholipid acyltransferase family protein [Armatimonadota bacterium]